MIGGTDYNHKEFNELLMLNDWVRERAAEDAWFAEQALLNTSHQTLSELENAC